MVGSLKILNRTMNKEKVLGEFQNFLAIDPQDDCSCDVEIYDTLETAICVWLKQGEPETTTNQTRIRLPMSLNPIDLDQFKKCLLAALALAKPISISELHSYYQILIHPAFDFDKLSDDWKNALLCKLWPMRILHLEEIPENHIYLAPDPEFVGCFTWNLSGHGMFILADRLGVHVI